MFTTRSLLADIEAVLVFWLLAVFQWMCWSAIISKGQTEKLVFSIPILIILQFSFRRWNVTNLPLWEAERAGYALQVSASFKAIMGFFLSVVSFFSHQGLSFIRLGLWTPRFWLAWGLWLILRRSGCSGDFSCWHTQWTVMQGCSWALAFPVYSAAPPWVEEKKNSLSFLKSFILKAVLYH